MEKKVTFLNLLEMSPTFSGRLMMLIFGSLALPSNLLSPTL
jgi:hypothetical protein